MTPCILVTTDPIMVQLLLKGAILLLTHSVKRSLANPNQYLKPKYTEEGKFILEHLRYNDVLEVEQKDLPRSLHTVFKLFVDEVQSCNKFLLYKSLIFWLMPLSIHCRVSYLKLTCRTILRIRWRKRLV